MFQPVSLSSSTSESMTSNDLLSSIPSPLSVKLRHQINEIRSRIIKNNYNTQFAQTAHELAAFRHVTAGLVDDMDDDILAGTFQKSVQFTTYDSYAPLIARLFEKPCKTSAIVDLLAPGLPEFIVKSSSTSGGIQKTLPRYDCASKIRASDAGSWGTADPYRRGTKAYVCYLWYDRMEVEDEDGSNHSGVTIYLSSASAATQRMKFGLDPEKDEERMGTIVLDHVAPYAAGFIKKWRSFLLIHALFAVGSRTLETMDMLFINTFVDMVRCLDTEFDMVVDCIENGTIPDLDGIDHVRHYLQSNIFPDPERAAELRRIGRPSSRPGWCRDVWLKLCSITTISTGSFASSVPLARWFLGPDVGIRCQGLRCAEAIVGLPYNELESNQYKPVSGNILEFLDITQCESIDALAQFWEVKLGRQYELVITTPDGLWRYRLGDVVEISGFGPTDGVPIMQFVARRNMCIRLPVILFSEEELRAAISFLPQSVLVKLVDWTAMVDDQRVPPTIGFFIELTSDEVPELALAPNHVLNGLSRINMKIARLLAGGFFRAPVIRVVRSGTFNDLRQLKLDEGNTNVGQIKVPVALHKTEYITWLSDRVVQEL